MHAERSFRSYKCVYLKLEFFECVATENSKKKEYRNKKNNCLHFETYLIVSFNLKKAFKSSMK
jgi:hypothetical protein